MPFRERQKILRINQTFLYIGIAQEKVRSTH